MVTVLLTVLLDIVAVGLLALGSIVTGISVYGVLRMPDVYSQLHAAGMGSGVGAIAILLASIATAHRLGGLPSARLAEPAVGALTPRPRIVVTDPQRLAAADWR